MEFMTSGSLESLLSSHELMWPKKFLMIHEITMGMNFLHSTNPPLLHLNLKLANVLLDHHLHVKISDFGLIKWEEFSNRTEFIEHLTMRGNLSYIPPETFTESCDPPGTKFDVYSFSIVMWEILTQKKAFPGANMMTVLMKVSSGKRPNVEKLPDDKPQESEAMIDIMQRCWQQKSSDRPPFSDTVRETEALSEGLKFPDVLHACKDVYRPHKLPYTTVFSLNKEPRTKMNPDSGGGVSQRSVDFLSKKDFENFKRSLKREDVLEVYEENYSLLHYTVASGDAEAVELVLQQGAAVDSQNDRGYTPLVIGVLRQLYDVCALLVQRGADASLGDADRWTPLHFAAQNGDDRIARLLLEHGRPRTPPRRTAGRPCTWRRRTGTRTWCASCCRARPRPTPRRRTAARPCTWRPPTGTWSSSSCCSARAPTPTGRRAAAATPSTWPPRRATSGWCGCSWRAGPRRTARTATATAPSTGRR
ncbi:hypothetical protein ANANG_G00233400 [Anguilla anguilla]|uniref:Protein kinase domain-containing protein n=1 Tax=Anguilla anguilla TaxID=7936 RepID=A0A9D3LTT4_ANGAN|nr:hypothetical protein ANANG_G00233400 [Anguilla anguilla]